MRKHIITHEALATVIGAGLLLDNLDRKEKRNRVKAETKIYFYFFVLFQKNFGNKLIRKKNVFILKRLPVCCLLDAHVLCTLE